MVLTMTAADNEAVGASQTATSMMDTENTTRASGALTGTKLVGVQCSRQTDWMTTANSGTMHSETRSAKLGACWGCFKGATNSCECFGTPDWSGSGMTRPTATAKKGGTDGGPPRRAFQAPPEI